jgi:hypothetical protein
MDKQVAAEVVAEQHEKAADAVRTHGVDSPQAETATRVAKYAADFAAGRR